MKYNEQVKAVFFDVDGTLLDFRTHELSESSVQAVEQLQAAGIRCALATSRPLRTIKEVPGLMEIPWDGIVSGTGMMVYDGQGRLICDRGFPQNTLEQIVSTAKNASLPVYMAGEEVIMTEDSDLVEPFLNKYNVTVDAVRPWTGEKPVLITLLTTDHDYARELFENIPGIELVSAGRENMDIHLKGIDKPDGIRVLMDHWKLPPAAFAAVGDTGIDSSMLEAASPGLCMPLGEQAAKESADAVLEDHGPDTILTGMKRYILQD